MITLQDIHTRQTELAAMIERFAAQPAQDTACTVVIDAAAIELRPGEHYAGAVLDAEGSHKHHLVLMAAVPAERMTWGDAKAWAEQAGGELPTRQEQALLFANCKQHIEANWHLSCEENGASYAWGCYFYHGYQDFSHKSYEGCARAVRRV